MKQLIIVITIFSYGFGFSQNNNVKAYDLPYEHYQLKNGLEVVLQHDSNVKNVTVEYWIKDGYRIDTEGNFGLMHFYEHVMPYIKMDSLSYAHYKKLRTDSNAQVRPDFSRYYLEMKPKGLTYALQNAAGRLKAPASAITSKRVEYERKRVLDEIDRNASNPLWSAPGGMALHIGIFGKHHPYGHEGYGLVSNNERFTLEAFRKRHDEIVYANNVVLFIVGNFDITTIKKSIQTYFGSLPSRTKKKVTIPPSTHATKSVTMPTPSLRDTLNTLVFSWQIPKYQSKDNDALSLFASVLDNRMKKYQKKAIVSSEVYTELYEFSGQFTTSIKFTKAKDSNNVASLFKKEMQALLKNGITASEMQEAKEAQLKTIKEMQQYLGFGYSRTELLGEGLLFAKNPNYFFNRLQRQQQLSAKSVVKTAENWLQKTPFRLLFVKRNKVVISLNTEARKLKRLVKTLLAKSLLKKVPLLDAPTHIAPIYYNKKENKALSLTEYNKLKDTSNYKKLNPNSTYYYYTRYGTPLAYILPFELLGNLPELANKPLKILDYGFGTIGHLKLLTENGHIVHGIEADPILDLLYKKEVIANNRLKLLYGYFPKDKSLVKRLDDNYDVFISKNTLKKGYVHPDVEVDKKYLLNLGVSDADYLKAIYKLLKPRGYFLIYNLHGKIADNKKDYKPWTDGRSPFTKSQYEKAGFKIIGFDTDATEIARKAGKAFGWDAQMNFEKDLFATYTLLQKL